MPNTWLNQDGLRIWFGRDEGVDTHVGEYGAFSQGSIHHVRLDLNPESLGGPGKKVFYSVRLPGANDQPGYIKEATVFVEQAGTGGGAITAIGLDNLDGTVFDADGIDAAVAVGTAGATVTCDGALVNTRLTTDQPTNITVTTTGTFTALKAWLELKYFVENV